MAFLRTQDYKEFISVDQLNQILEQSSGIPGDTIVLAGAEIKSITRAKEYLTSRFHVDRIFKDFRTFVIGSTYTFGDRINWSFDEWTSGIYSNGDRVNYEGRVYIKNATTISYTATTLPTNATFFDDKGPEGIYYIAYPSEYDEDKVYAADDLVYFSHEIYKRNNTNNTETAIQPTNTGYFTRIKTSEYLTYKSVTAVYPTDALWTFGDNRNQTMIEIIIHMVLNKIYSLINPRNIPELRRDNYSNSIALLKEFQKGVTQCDIPDRQLIEQEGYSARFGSNTPTTHGY